MGIIKPWTPNESGIRRPRQGSSRCAFPNCGEELVGLDNRMKVGTIQLSIVVQRENTKVIFLDRAVCSSQCGKKLTNMILDQINDLSKD